uniref:ARID domain-containing protein n=1 Tax=Glossina brevipalpis TaxID=37001 RepID=A0A1A9WYW1_9MUSC
MFISEDQIQELYEINDDPKRKEFLDDLFSFMQKRGTPINRLPIMAKSVLDLYELYNLVIARGGLVDVINKKLWQEIIKGLHLPSSITSAAFTLRTQYMKYLYPYECEKKNLSTPAELQAAIDGNRREGRRSSYGQYEAIHNQMPMQQIARQSLSGGLQQMSPLALVSHAAAANNPQAAAQAAAAAAHHRLMTSPAVFAQMPNLMSHEIEQRMLEYLKLLQVNKEQNVETATSAISNSNDNGNAMTHSQQQSNQQHPSTQRQSSQSPELSQHEAFSALEMSRVALWRQMCNNHACPSVSVNTSPHGEGVSGEVGNSNAKNGGEISCIKREREHETSPERFERDDFFNHQPPPPKRAGFPASFYLPTASNFQYKDNDSNGDPHPEPDEDDGEQNSTANSPPEDTNERPLNGVPAHLSRFHEMSNSVHHDKSDDSAIENSPSTSAASGATAQVSPISTKKIHLSKQVQQPSNDNRNDIEKLATCNSAFDLFSGLQFRVTRSDVSTNGEQQLAVNLELNGVKYSGILNANISGVTKTTNSESNDNNNKDNDNDDNKINCIGDHCASTSNTYATPFEQSKAIDSTLTETLSDTETPSRTQTDVVTTNGSTKATLNDTLLTS